MEKPEVCVVASSRKFSDDLSAVYEHINTYRRVNADDTQADKTKSRDFAGIAAVVLLVIIGALYATLYFLPATTWGDNTNHVRVGIQLMVLIIYVMGSAVMLLQYRSVKDLYKDFTGQIIDATADLAKDETALFESLNELSTQSIEYVANRLEQASTQLSQIRTFLLGAIEKVGIIPGLLATVIAISKVADSTGISWVELLSFLLAGIYMSMFPIFEASIKTKRISVLLNQYLILFRSDEAARETKNELQQKA